MPHDPARVADAGEWLAKGASDVRGGAHQLTAEPPFTADAVFHAQQPAEKSLKGFLPWHDVPFRKTHDLAELGHECSQLDPSLEGILRRAAVLTAYAWKYRYPGEYADPSPEEAEAALSLAREVHQAVTAALPPEVHP